MADHVEIDGVRLNLGHPDPSVGQWIGQSEVLRQLLACWLAVDERDDALQLREVAAGLGLAADRGDVTASRRGRRAHARELRLCVV